MEIQRPVDKSITWGAIGTAVGGRITRLRLSRPWQTNCIADAPRYAPEAPARRRKGIEMLAQGTSSRSVVEGAQPEKILVVDDIEDNRTVAAYYLRAAGYRVTLAESGESALLCFPRDEPDLVLLDLLMPGLDGFETCRRLRALPRGSETPIVFLTALNEIESYERAMTTNPDDFLTKPIGRTELLIRVRSLLRIRRLQRELEESYHVVCAQRDAMGRLQRQKEELSALLVHDMKNPLSAILLEAQFVLGGMTATANADNYEAVNSILASAESMDRMVMNLLDIGRSEDGALVPRLALVSVEDMVREVCKLMRRRAEEKEQRLELAIRITEPIWCDRDLLRRVLENILDNCIRHSPRGSTVSVDSRVAADGAFELTVRDSGPGVAPADRLRIFEKYVQLERDAATPVRTNRGLGLLFCRLAVAAHGGRIWVEPSEPCGSAFCVRIPARTGPSS
jgi:two-component system, sensor histidine kinase and response regulator